MLNFQEMYASYASDVYRFAYWLAGNAAEAEDIASETFIRAWINKASIRTETFKAYLLQIARNIYLEWRRKHKYQVDLEDIYPDPRPGPEKLVEDHAEMEMVQRMLQAMPEIDRAAFILRVVHDLPYAEIARVLRLSETAAKVKVHRTRKRMLIARMSKEVT